MKKILTAGLIVSACSAVLSAAVPEKQEEINITDHLKNSFFQRLEKGNFNRRIAPHFSERKVWENVRRDLAKELISAADRIITEPVLALSFYDYLYTGIDGNRSRSETPYFKRRHNLQILATACCITGNTKKYLPKLIDYLWAVAAEPYWCPYAHVTRLPDDIMVTDAVSEKNDLFATATGAEVAIILNILGDELSKFSPGMVDKIRRITLQKTVDSILNPERDPMHGWLWTKTPNNWTPWCANQVLTTAVALERDGKKLGQLIRKLNRNVSLYYNRFPANGFCEEGVLYWEVGAGNLCSYLCLLDQIEPGCMKEIFESQKFRFIGDFPARAMVTPELAATFSDAAAKAKIDPALVRRFGRLTKSSAMSAYANQLEKLIPLSHITNHNQAQLPCTFFARVTDPVVQIPSVPENGGLSPLDFFPPRFAIIRNPQGFSATFKGGSNRESHNHNDLGHFTVYYRKSPVVIDAGTMGYTLKTFSNQRYELWYTGAQGHNAPEINGIRQQAGEYTCEIALLKNDPALFKADLSKAYPAEAKVRKFERTFEITPQKITVRDSLALAGKECKVLIRLHSPLPVRIEKGTVLFGNDVRLTLKRLVPGRTDKLEADAGMAKNYAKWIHVIELNGSSPEYEMIFTPR